MYTAGNNFCESIYVNEARRFQGLFEYSDSIARIAGILLLCEEEYIFHAVIKKDCP